jgi:hypothetical protein
MKNIIVEIPGQQAETIIIASHYDTKEFQRLSLCRRQRWRLRAPEYCSNWPASSPPIQARREVYSISLSSSMAKRPSAVNGASVSKATTTPTAVATWPNRFSEERPGRTSIKAMILLDMIGDRNLAIPREENSSPWLVDAIWQTARELGPQRHFPEHDPLDDR